MVKTSLVIYVATLLPFAMSCGVSQSEYDSLRAQSETLTAENTVLKTELDECNNGAEKLIAKVEKAYKQKQYSLARQNIERLYSKHPESPKNAEFKKLLKMIKKKELEQQKRKEAKEREKNRLANLKNTGMWRIRHYVDDFGEPTKQGYITNTMPIEGTFSNSATQDSDLKVLFLITSSSDITIQLYEYAGNNPVKGYTDLLYNILIKGKDKQRLKLTAAIRDGGDRMIFGKEDSKRIHNVLRKGGTIEFRIAEVDTPTTKYKFAIQNADWYGNAYKKLMGR